jgi:hypothetical protein
MVGMTLGAWKSQKIKYYYFDLVIFTYQAV